MGWKNDGAHDDVRMAIEVFCKAMQNNVCAEEERGGVEWRHEGIVYQDKWS